MAVETKTVVFNLKDPLLSVLGEEMKDTSEVDKSKLATYTKAQMVNLPSYSIGIGLISLINNKKNCKDLEEMSKMSRMIVKIRNKMVTAHGEWTITKDELLDIEDVFKSAPPAELSIHIHGQIYNKIQDLIRQLV